MALSSSLKRQGLFFELTFLTTWSPLIFLFNSSLESSRSLSKMLDKVLACSRKQAACSWLAISSATSAYHPQAEVSSWLG